MKHKLNTIEKKRDITRGSKGKIKHLRARNIRRTNFE